MHTPKRSLISLAMASCLLLPAFATAQSKNSAQIRSFDVAAGPLGRNLSTIASQNGIPLSFDPALTLGLKSMPVKGELTALQALEGMLQGSALKLIENTDGSYTLKKISANAPLLLAPITVKGEITERALLQTYNSLDVKTEDRLVLQNIETLASAVMRTPGITQTGTNGGYAIRGMTHTGIQASTFGETLSVHIDGVRQPRETLVRNPFALFDTQQIEIYRGGQSTSRGAASIAGGIEIVSNDPAHQQEIKLQFGAKYSEQHDSTGYNMNAMLNQPINDNWAIRATGTVDDFDGYTWNPTRNTFNDKEELTNGRIKLGFRSDERTLTAVTTYSYSDTSEGSASIPRPGGSLDFDGITDSFERIRTTDVEELNEQTVSSLAQKIDWQITNRYSISALVSHLRMESDALIDADQTAAEGNIGRILSERGYTTAELKLRYADDVQNYLIGLYTQREDYEVETTARQDIGAALMLPFSVVIEGVVGTDAKRTNSAIFSEYERKLSDKLSVRAGLRYDYEQQDVESDTNTTLSPPLPLPIENGFAENDADYSALLPSFSATWTIDSTQTLTLLVKQDYRAGGVTTNIVQAGNAEFDPEETSTAELAWRKDKDTLTIQSNLYYTRWKDQQINRLVDFGGIQLNVIDNAGKSTQHGLEASIQYRPNETIETYFSFAYNQTKFDEYKPSDLLDFSGNQFPFAPKWSANAGLTWFISDEISWDTNLNYQDESFSSSNNDQTAVNDSFVEVNTNIRYEHHDWYGSVWITNLTDREYIARAGASDSLGLPRTFGINIGINF